MVLTIRKKSSVLTNLCDFSIKGFSFETLDFFSMTIESSQRMPSIIYDKMEWNTQHMKLLDIERG